MGSAASKAKPRTLQKTVKESVKLAESAVYERPKEDIDFEKRLQQLGQVQYVDNSPKFEKNNENLSAINARKRITQQATSELEDYSKPKTRIQPQTISAILQARSEGDSDKDIVKEFHLDENFLKRLGLNVSIPTASKSSKSTRESEESPVVEAKKSEGIIDLSKIRAPKKGKKRVISI